jgi:ABC-type nickel/cobalt efflux system permease component RcnA
VTGGLLVATVGAVGVLHTLVPDHWAPIVVLARQHKWSVMRTARAAALAGVGHVTSTLLLGVVLWVVGATAAARYGHIVSVVSALALIGFGLWIAYGGWKETRAGAHHDHEHGGEPHSPAQHDTAGSRTALVLIVGSSPMIEGIPAFLAASTYGFTLLAVMAVVFALATIITYVVTCVTGVVGLRRTSLGPLERYGELISGALVALVGVYALATA